MAPTEGLHAPLRGCLAPLRRCTPHYQYFFTGDDWEVIQQEVIILQECKHPNIVAYMGSYLSKERLWITMEFCSGGKHVFIFQTASSEITN